ncbi:hypothetical protein ACHAXS_005686 [Conticribra weissflogii]
MNLTFNQKNEIADMLSWSSISKWDFDVLEFDRLLCKSGERGSFSENYQAKTKARQYPGNLGRVKYGSSRCAPLLMLGWAILGSPYSQTAMQLSLETNVTVPNQGYNFVDELNISMPELIQTLRCVEYNYKDVPYHNNLHAADVLQTVHALLHHAPTRLAKSPSSISKEVNMHKTNFPFLQNVSSVDLYSI